MLQYKPEEILAFEGTIACYTATALHVLKSDVSVLAGNDTVFTDDSAV